MCSAGGFVDLSHGYWTGRWLPHQTDQPFQVDHQYLLRGSGSLHVSAIADDTRVAGLVAMDCHCPDGLWILWATHGNYR